MVFLPFERGRVYLFAFDFLFWLIYPYVIARSLADQSTRKSENRITQVGRPGGVRPVLLGIQLIAVGYVDSQGSGKRKEGRRLSLLALA